MAVKRIAAYLLSKSGYPSITHGLINRFADSELRIPDSARVSRNCRLVGDIELGPHAHVHPGCKLLGDVTVGRGTQLNPGTKAVGDIDIGNYCAIAESNLFKEGNHLVTKPSMQMRFYADVLDEDLESTSHGPIEIENDVWMGARAIVLSGVTIGSGAIVGAGSVVTRDVEPYSVVAGAPAERIKWRFPEDVRERLLDLSWWDWGEEKMVAHRDFFTREIEGVGDIPDTV